MKAMIVIKYIIYIFAVSLLCVGFYHAFYRGEAGIGKWVLFGLSFLVGFVIVEVVTRRRRRE